MAHPGAGSSPLPGVSPTADSAPAAGWDVAGSLGVDVGRQVAAIDAPLRDLQSFGWSWPLEVVVPLVVLAGLYAVGWWRLEQRRRDGRAVGTCAAMPDRRARRRAVAVWRPVAGLAGTLCLGAALLSPLAALSHVFFVAHMTQHMLLIAAAAPLLLLANPFPCGLWALPQGARRWAGRLLTAGSPLRLAWSLVTAVPVAGVVYAAVLWAWHQPGAYDAALRDERVHHLEHLAFFGGAVLFWWPVIGPAPRTGRAPSSGARIAHVLIGALQGSLLAVLISLSPRVIYASYTAARAPSLGPLDDQWWGGIVMWAIGGAVDMLAVLILVWRFLAAADRQHPRRASPAASAQHAQVESVS